MNGPSVRANPMPRVTILQRILPHYRVAFFCALHRRLRRDAIELTLIYGQEKKGTVPRTVPLEEEWAQRISNRYIEIVGAELVWQPALAGLKGADLIVVEPSNRLLLNDLLLLRGRWGRAAVACWGHGRNFQSAYKHGLRESVKRALGRQAAWWFAYTSLSADAVAQSGYPRERITVVQNTIDTQELAADLAAVGDEEIERLRGRLGIRSGNVAVYCGGLYADKRLDFLLRSCREVRRRVPDFHAIFVGDGPEAGKISGAAAAHSWIHYAGARFGRERAAYFRLGKALLMPGLVGLAIVDSFVASLPIFTTDVPIHSPEIAYLEHGRNGVMTRYDESDYAEAVARYLESPDMQATLAEGCRSSAGKYTLPNMVENFASGVERCLALPDAANRRA
jgi:glycosyltransferase involved in cell wall biosynthesis